MEPCVSDIGKEIEREVSGLYGARLVAVLVYGSYARGEADEESDFDVLIVLDRLENYAAEVDRTGEIVAGISLRYGVSVSRVFLSEAEWRNGRSVFLQNVRKEGVPL